MNTVAIAAAALAAAAAAAAETASEAALAEAAAAATAAAAAPTSKHINTAVHPRRLSRNAGANNRSTDTDETQRVLQNTHHTQFGNNTHLIILEMCVWTHNFWKCVSGSQKGILRGSTNESRFESVLFTSPAKYD